jgi:hypothetical protein
MTLNDAKKLTAKRDYIFWRAGADTIERLSVRQANKTLKFIIEDGGSLDSLRFQSIGGWENTLYIDESSWIEYHEGL